MAKSHSDPQNPIEVKENYTEMEDSDYIDLDSDDSEEDPTYIDDLTKTQSKFSNFSINSRGRDHSEVEIDDEEVSGMEEMRPLKLGIKDVKDVEEIQRLIDRGLVEKLKVEQLKAYLRKYGLRLTGKKENLIQRIKEHSEILKGGGEKKFPPSSFVLNCKGDACMGDAVMFEQTVYEGYNIASRSATGPPCGKRTVAGRIVKESYGAAKQQHTFTVEVLWSKGHKPLPPLHPLLIKGRNLYKLNTVRQRWEDESERQRVLSEKHSRGSIARSNREARIQERISKKMLKGTRVRPKDGQDSREKKNHRHATDHVSIPDSKNVGSKAHKQHTVAKKPQQQQVNKEQILKVPVEYKENSHAELPVSQPSQPIMPASNLHHDPTLRVRLAYKDQNSSLPHIYPPKFKHSRPTETTIGSHCGFSEKYQQIRQHPRQQHYLEYEKIYVQPDINSHSLQQNTSGASTCHLRQKPKSHYSDIENFITSGPYNIAYSDKFQHPQHESCSSSQPSDLNRTSLHYSYGINHQKEQQLCQYYPQGKCYYGNCCKFSHVY